MIGDIANEEGHMTQQDFDRARELSDKIDSIKIQIFDYKDYRERTTGRSNQYAC